jgi:membrane protein DedA with SNARE-associated domain
MLDGWVRSLVESGGLAGVAFLMALENVVPPIPSEIVMPLAGFAASTGELTLPGVIAAGVAGSVGGALALYALGAWLGGERLERLAERHGRWLLVERRDVTRAEEWFRRHGALAVLGGRVVPGVRSLVSIPAGVCGMPLGRFVLLTALGSAVWVTLLGSLGYWLGERWEAVGRWVGPLALVVLAGLLVAHVVTAWRRRSE